MAYSSTPHDGQDRDYRPPPAEPVNEIEAESMGSLLSRLMSELATLFRKEVALAKAELTEAAGQTRSGIIAMAAGGAVLFAGALVLLAFVVLLLAQVMVAWLAALIVGAVLNVVGFVMLQSGKKKFAPAALKPERTQESLRKDKEMITRRTHE